MSSAERVIDPVSQVELVVPVFATPERAIRRAALQRQGELRTIRFFPDWGHAWPLWENSTDGYDLCPEDLDVSEKLAQDLRQWHDDWSASFARSLEWSTEKVAERWRQSGDQLLARLQEEVWDFAEVVGTHRTY
jgi:hypothetical protein